MRSNSELPHLFLSMYGSDMYFVLRQHAVVRKQRIVVRKRLIVVKKRRAVCGKATCYYVGPKRCCSEVTCHCCKSDMKLEWRRSSCTSLLSYFLIIAVFEL